MKKQFFLPLISLLLWACSSDWDKIMEEQFPYGVWRSKTEYYVELKNNDSYEVCDSINCNAGKIGWTNPNDDGVNDYGPYLLDFDKKPIGLKFMEESGYYYIFSHSEYKKIAHPSFFQHHEHDPSLGFCKAGPCKPFGGDARPQYNLYLVKK